VSERAIATTLVACHDAGLPVEPSAAAAVAALRDGVGSETPGPVAVVMTGRNVDGALVERARQSPDSFPG
jgi:threonine dehydratase